MSAAPTRGLTITRPLDDRLVAGVAGGLGRHFGIDPLIVRLSFAVLGLASGFGVFSYVVAWAVMPAADSTEPVGAHDRGRALERSVAVGMLTAGVLLLVRRTGIWFPDGLVWPAALLALGLSFVWSRADDTERARWRQRADALQGEPLDALGGGRRALLRLGVGIVFLFVGLAAFVATNDRFAAAGAVAMAILAVVVGVGLLLGPWILRLFRDLATERRERIRSDERAEVAAHLHDSVLQTLALIQRRSDSPTEMVALARRQERELRTWLYGRGTPTPSVDTLAAAFGRVVDEIEEAHPVQVDLVMVGDRELDADHQALVAAAREAVVNAAKHAGVDEVSVYCEVTEDTVTVYVRDRGKGFDVHAVDDDRKGLSASVVGRMRRHGGSASITSLPGVGTEVVLELVGSVAR